MFVERYEQYAESLPLIAALKAHRKTIEMLAFVDGLDEQWRPLRSRLLSSPEYVTLATRFPSKVARALEGKWGFAGLIEALHRSGDPLFHEVVGLNVPYEMSSQIQHGSYDGAMTVLERSQRSADRTEAITYSPQGRIISDVFMSFFWRVGSAYRYIQADQAPMKAALARYQRWQESYESDDELWLALEYRTPKR